MATNRPTGNLVEILEQHAKDIRKLKSKLTNVGGITPVGGIIMWSGSIASIPAGWALCDGANGTPNLQNRFIVGAGDSYAVDATGGATSVTLTEAQMPSHNHSGPNHSHSLSNHQHSIQTFRHDGGEGPHDHAGTGNHVSKASVDTGTAHNSTTGSGGGGSTGNAGTGNTGIAGSDQAHENRPPYYALAFIMRTA